MATTLKIKGRAWLKELGFTILTENRPLYEMKFRINIYRKEDDQYILQNLNPRCFDYDISQLDNGLFTYPFGAPVYIEYDIVE